MSDDRGRSSGETLISDLDPEILEEIEDIGLARAIEEGKCSETVSRDCVFSLLEGA